MSAPAQEDPDRQQNLKNGRCPQHGIRMTQINHIRDQETNERYVVVSCPHRNCSVRARANGMNGPWELVEA